MFEEFEFNYYRGRVALFSMLKAIGVGKGDTVVTQAFTCLAVPEAIMATGARPIYADIEKGSVNMDPESLRKSISTSTKAIVIQHTFGIPARLNKLLEVAEEFSLPVIEDCCHTYSSTYNGKPVGSFGVGSFYSFEWGKPLVVGIGGGLKVNAQEYIDNIATQYNEMQLPGLTDRIKIEIQYWAFKILLRPSLYWPLKKAFHKLSKSGLAKGNYNDVEKEEVSLDFSLRLSSGLKARLKSKLKSIDKFTSISQRNSNFYKENIKSEKISFLTEPDGTDTVYARFPLIADNKEELLKKAEQNSIEVADWYNTVIHPLKDDDLEVIHYKSGSCPNAEWLSERVISLPVGKSVGNKYRKQIKSFLNSLNA